MIPLGMLCIALEQARPLCLWKRSASVKLVDAAYAFGKAADMKKGVSTEKNGYVGFQLMYLGTVPWSYVGLLNVRAAAYV